MILQLNPPLPVEVIGEKQGKGNALFLIDYSPEHDLIWVIGYDDTKEIWCVNNKYVRLQANWTFGR